MKNKCNILLKQTYKKYLKYISNKGAATSKRFCETVKPYITDKGIEKNENITTEVEKKFLKRGQRFKWKVDVRTKDQIKDKKILVEIFDKYYRSILEEAPVVAPKILENRLDPELDEKTIRKVIQNCWNHPSIIKIKKKVLRKNPYLVFLRLPHKT